MLHPLTVLFASAALAYAVAFLLTRSIHIAFWSFFGTFVYEWPKALYLFGVSGLENLTFFNYTVGIVLIPFFLVILNFVFIQINMFVRMKFVFRLVHGRKKGFFNTMKLAMVVNDGIHLLQKYDLLPEREESRKVYLAGAIAGLTRLSVFLYAGM